MARDGAGNYGLPAGNPVVTATVISSTAFNSTASDIATALTNSIAKDGQTTPSANLPMGGNKHTGVADGSLGNQYASINQTQNGSLISVGSIANIGNAYTGSVTPSISTYTDGMMITFTPNATSTGAATLALNGLAVKSIFKNNGAATLAGDLTINVKVIMIYSAAAVGWVLQNPLDVTLSPTWTGLHTFNGKVVIGAPPSGTALDVTALAGNPAVHAHGAAGQDAVQIRNPSAASTSFGLAILAGTNINDYAMNVVDATATRNMFQIKGSGNLIAGPPTSGVTLALTAVATGTAQTWTDGTRSGALNFLAANMELGTTTAHGLDLYTGGATRFNINNSGACLINTPSAGDALTISAVASQAALALNGNTNAYALRVSGPGTAGQSFGIKIQAGTNAADNSFVVANVSNANYLIIRGDGTMLAADDGGSLQVVGWRDLPQNLQAGNYAPVLADRGKSIYLTAGTTITIPANASVAFPVGTVLTFVNGLAGNATIAITTDTMVLAGTATTGSRTLASNGIATAYKRDATTWIISGPGVS